MAYTLGQLVFDIVKETITIPNDYPSYQDFLNGLLNSRPDYAVQCSGVFNALNLALSRLQDCHKLPFKTKSAVVLDNNKIYFPDGKIENIVFLTKGSYERIEFRTLDSENYLLLTPYNLKTALVEYQPELKVFTINDVVKNETNEDNEVIAVDSGLDLKLEYGIDSRAVAYLKEYCKGILFENLDPQIANYHRTLAEQYMQAMPTYSTSFYQNKIKVRSIYGF